MNERHIHESLENRRHVEKNEGYQDPQLTSIQQAEGGGPIKKVNLTDMPLPLRIFGYTVKTILILMVVGTIIVSLK
ncbi:hypothetical protein D3P07_25785 [Paenibacillus sp. 1011MAR3C5]|uniref:hypothetical protein n=1 Tax=Paenibacillus sp. 1011MAR3C5 TaxID=1675787 RepID=UPI000E6BBD51|nr:hypothetical protein [Paenibacillus sp. 1011MAR3C5]RJE83045.1 hypothetical protein D3P07_25785 [Paenibacillus sp. 1011MAR3C5]